MISKQVIVMRKDLNMRRGKMVAQGAHASLKAILDRMDIQGNFKYISSDGSKGEATGYLKLEGGTALNDWISGRFTKICVSVDSEAELFDIVNKAQSAGLPCALITDAGLTEFGGVPTRTCCAIGPAWSDEIDKITGHLKLL